MESIHPTVIVSDRCVIGEDCWVGEGTVLGAIPLNLKIVEGRRARAKVKGRLIIEDNVTIDCNCVLNLGVDGDTVIREGVFIGHLSSIGHDAEIGRHTVVSVHVSVLGRVKIGEWCYIAPQTVIRNRIKIGDYTLIGMGSVVTKDMPSSVIAYGNPCRVIKENVWRP